MSTLPEITKTPTIVHEDLIGKTAKDIRKMITANKKHKRQMPGYSTMSKAALVARYSAVLNGTAEPAKRKTSAPSKWTMALKQWNAGRDKYTIPKKGSTDYAEVKAIQEKL